jgi:Ca2+-transporting ATPase
MGPMCSIVYENEPAEKTACKITKTNRQYFLIAKELGISIVQGIGITIGIYLCTNGPYKMEVTNTNNGIYHFSIF